MCVREEKWDVLEDDLGYIGCVGDEEVGEDEVRVELWQHQRVVVGS